MSRAEMVFTTLSSTGRRVFQQLAAASNNGGGGSGGSGKNEGVSSSLGLFDTVLVDEAAQATEPAALQALRFGARSCVLVGDPRQLPATVLSGGAARAGLARSLFERLANGEGGGGGGGGGETRGGGGGIGGGATSESSALTLSAAATKVPVSLLRVQYRMHPQIRSFPSRAFYAGALEDAEAVRRRPDEPWQERRRLLGPYLFFDVSRGREARGGSGSGSGGGSGRGGAAPFFASSSLSSSSSPSVRNDEEAALAAALVAELRAECRRVAGGGGGNNNDAAAHPPPRYPVVGVITPYRAQASALRAALEAAGGGPRGRDWCRAVETVDSFQGKEVDVAIVSCVRTRGGEGREYCGGGGDDDGEGGENDDGAAAVARALAAALDASTFSYDSRSSASTNPPPVPVSSSVGFVDDLRRLNVAVTRAKKALWVLGSGEALRKGSAAWAALLADASRRGVVVKGASASRLFPEWWARMQQQGQQREQQQQRGRQQQESWGRGRGGGRGGGGGGGRN